MIEETSKAKKEFEEARERIMDSVEFIEVKNEDIEDEEIEDIEDEGEYKEKT